MLDEGLIDESGSKHGAEQAVEREERENEHDEAFVEALTGLTHPTRSVPMFYAETPTHVSK